MKKKILVLLLLTMGILAWLIIRNNIPEPIWLKNQPNIVYDQNGVPYFNYRSKHGIDLGMQRNPLLICRTANEYYSQAISSDSAKGIEFMSCINWLEQNIHQEGNFASLHYNFPFPPYDLESPWISGMANGLALETYYNAFLYTNDSIYVKRADQILNSFNTFVNDGGVKVLTQDGDIWFEEYPVKGEKTLVLNGMIFSLLSIDKYAKDSGNENAKKLYESGLKSVKKNLSLYEGNGECFYDGLQKPITEEYLQLHINLMGDLYALDGDTIFLKYAKRWRKIQEKF